VGQGLSILDTETTESADFDGQISRPLAEIDVSLDDWASLAGRFKMDIFCGWFMQESNEHIVVSPQTLRALGERNIALPVEIYAPLDD
jgi:hypothetical protein